jgi:hypothetical protein
MSCFGVGLSLCLFIRSLSLCLIPFPWGKNKVSDPSAGCCYQSVVMVRCLFLNAAESSDSGCPVSEPCSLLPSLLPYFWQWPITHLLAALLPFVYWWFMWVWLLSSPLLLTFSNPCPLCCALVFISIVYLFYLFIYFLGRISLFWEAVLVYPRSGWGILCDTWLSPVWSVEGLPRTFGASSICVPATFSLSVS